MKVYQVVYDVFKSNFFDKCSDEEVLVFIQFYIDIFFIFVEYDLFQFDLKFYFFLKMMVFYLNVFSGYFKVLNCDSIISDLRNLYRKVFFNFGDICSVYGYFFVVKIYFEKVFQIVNGKKEDNN